MKEILLTQGKVAVVDDVDYEQLSRYKWQFDRYAYRTIVLDNGKKRSIRMHRAIMQPPKGLVVDHINGDKLDNRRSNLRVVEYSVNSINRHCGKRPNSSSKYHGVFWDNSKQKWRASSRNKVIGRYETQEQAAQAYDRYVKSNNIMAPTNFRR